MAYPTGEKPTCMGKKSPATGEWYWQPQHPECAGGPDPAFVNPVDGGNTRPKCPWFAQCAAETSSNKLAEARVIPAQTQNAPLRIPVMQPQPQAGALANAARGIVQGVAQVAAKAQTPVPAPTPQPIQMYQQPQVPVRPPQWQPQPQPQQYQPYAMQAPQYGQVPMVPPWQAGMPQVVPMNMPTPGMQMMGYLAVPEPVIEGQHWAARLGFSVLRAMFKASGHTVANFFDFNTFGGPWPNGG